MKKFVIFLMLIFIYSCASQSALKKDEMISLEAKPLSEISSQTIGESFLEPKEDIKTLYGNLLSNVKASKISLNPSQEENVDISFNLTNKARVNINVYDPDGGLIKVIMGDQTMAQGNQKAVWDGKDIDGNVVPDEAYFFTIIASDKDGTEEIYDPTTFSGGVEHDITTADVSPENGTITYQIPEAGRVLIRMGIEGGPLLNTLVDWEPRVKGSVTEYWNGKDKDNLVDLYNNPKFKMIISYFSFPDNTVITYGNRAIAYKDYKKSLIVTRPVKRERTSSISKTSHHYKLPRTVDYSPELNLDFTNEKGLEKDGTVILQGKTIVKVNLNDADKAIFQNHQFEIVFFLDNEFLAEDETGYTPFNWVWDLSDVKEGEHTFTVNLSSFKDQIGVLSRKVKVVK